MKEVCGVKVKHFPFATRRVLLALARHPFVCKGLDVVALDDGSYDVMVLEATETPDGALNLELVVSSGPRRGEVVNVTARGLSRAGIELMGTPATLVVTDNEPRVTFP